MTASQSEKIPLHMLWIGQSISPIELLSISSFTNSLFDVNLWLYGKGEQDRGVIAIRDANEIIREEDLFFYEGGSPAASANLFRYRVLGRLGGLWTDTDVVNNGAARELFSDSFFVSEVAQSPDGQQKTSLNNNVIYCREPGDHVMRICEAVAEAFPKDMLLWGDIGPRLLTKVCTTYPRLAPRVFSPKFANPVPFWECPDVLLTGGSSAIEGASFVHLYTATWIERGASKGGPFPPDSIVGRLLERNRNAMEEVADALGEILPVNS